MRTIAIGDIHGMASCLDMLLEKVQPARDDQLIFLGDYVDRGRHSKEVIDRILQLKTDGHNVVALLGNHEQLMQNALANPEEDHFVGLWVHPNNGGALTLKSYDHEIPGPHLDFLNSLELYHEIDGYFFVHAGVDPRVPLEFQMSHVNDYKETFLWIRNAFITSGTDWGKKIVFGHTFSKEPINEPNKIGLDTGCFHTGRLTALVIDPDSDHKESLVTVTE